MMPDYCTLVVVLHQLKAENERLKVELANACELLKNGRTISWGWNKYLEKHGYYLCGCWAGPEIGDVIKKAAEGGLIQEVQCAIAVVRSVLKAKDDEVVNVQRRTNCEVYPV